MRVDVKKLCAYAKKKHHPQWLTNRKADCFFSAEVGAAVTGGGSIPLLGTGFAGRLFGIPSIDGETKHQKQSAFWQRGYRIRRGLSSS